MNSNHHNCFDNCRACQQFEREFQHLGKNWKKVFCQKCGIIQEKFFMDEFADGKIVCKDQISCQLRYQNKPKN